MKEVLGLLTNPAVIAPIAVALITWHSTTKKSKSDFSAATMDKWDELYKMVESQRNEYKEEVDKLKEEIKSCPQKEHHGR